MTSLADQDYCAEQARQHDYERYFAAVFAPPPRRRALMALYAFNLEIASTRERVSEPLIGEMRLQWWHDTIEGIYGGTVRNHAVARELAASAERFALPRAGLDALIDARAFDLEDEPPEDLAALEHYAAETAGGLAALAGRICGGGDEALARSAGTAWGLTGLLRAAPFHAAAGRVFVPRDALRRASTTADAFVRSRDREAVAAVVAPLAERARTLLGDLDAALRMVPRKGRPAVAYLPVAGMYLDRLDRRGQDVFSEGLGPGRLGMQLRTMRAALTGRF